METIYLKQNCVIVHPMTSFSGSVAYLQYVATSDKNGMLDKNLNGVFALGDMDENRMNYTAQAVVETIDSTGGCTFAWGPVLYNKENLYSPAQNANKIRVYVGGAWTEVPEDRLVKDANGQVTGIAAGYMAEGTKVAYRYNQEFIPAKDIPSIGPKMVNIPLVAEPRRIAVKYDQITAFQA